MDGSGKSWAGAPGFPAVSEFQPNGKQGEGPAPCSDADAGRTGATGGSVPPLGTSPPREPLPKALLSLHPASVQRHTWPSPPKGGQVRTPESRRPRPRAQVGVHTRELPAFRRGPGKGLAEQGGRSSCPRPRRASSHVACTLPTASQTRAGRPIKDDGHGVLGAPWGAENGREAQNTGGRTGPQTPGMAGGQASVRAPPRTAARG